MKKVTMKDFRWLGKPQKWEKTYKELTLTVEGMLCLPQGPLLLAVSDEDFTFSFESTLAPQGGLCGVCIYHTDTSYTAVGRSKTSLLAESVSSSSKSKTTVPYPSDERRCTWHLKRKGSEVQIGYASPSLERVEWVCTTSMISMQDSISFGPFFSNYTTTPFEASIENLRYVKSSE